MDLLYPAILFLSIILTTFNRGFFSFPLFTVLVSLLFLLFYLFYARAKEISVTLLTLVFLITYTLFMFNSSGIYESNSFFSLFLFFMPLLSYPLVLTYLFSVTKLSIKNRKMRLIFFVGLAFLLRLFMIAASPSPIIDVFVILKEAPLKFLSLINPYNTVYSTIYVDQILDYFPYWPASFLLQIPFVLLFKDPRVLLVTSDVLSAMGLYMIGKKSQAAEILSLIYLFRPNSNFIIEQSWLTPLTFFLAMVSFYIITLKKKNWLGGLILGLLISTQPIFAIVGAFYAVLAKNIKKYFFTIGLFVGIFVLPFVFWDSRNFFGKTIAVYFKDPLLVPTIPVYMSLNLNTFLHFVAGRDVPPVLSVLILFVVFLLIFKKLISARSTPSDVILGTAVFFLSFYFLFRQAFINYYYLTTDFIILWGITKWRSYSSS